MRAGFGQSNDYSSLFASLYNADQANRDAQAKALEARNKDRQAAADNEEFSKFQHGDISGAELLAYIRQRVADTKGDPTENEKWTSALEDYTQSINDQNAEDAYAAGGSINDLIAYYQGKQKGLKQGSPEYSTTQQRLYQLIDQAASDDLTMGAQRINDKIAAGQASLQDLADFYKKQMRSLRPNSPLKTQVAAQLDSVNNQIIQQATDSAAAKIDFQFKAGQITGVEANQQITALAAQFQNSNPTQYWQMMEQGQQYLQTQNQTAIPNLAALSQFGAPGATSSGTTRGWTPNSASYNPGNPDDVTKGFKFITQLDGSTFAKKNCVFASGAMLAEAMGVSGLSGGDLRWDSGDTSGGSTWAYLKKALAQNGVNVDVAWKMSFSDFTNKLANGQPAVVGGNTARLPDGLRGEYLGGHAIYVDRYDPKKGYLVFNPAKRNTNGQWWSAEVLQAFAWGNKTLDSAVFAPKPVGNASRPVPPQVTVWDKPKKPSTPPNYGVGNDPGVDGRSQTALNNAGITVQTSQTDAQGNPRPYNLPVPTTQDEVAAQRDKLQFQQDRAVAMADAFAAGDTYYVEADGTHTPLTQTSVLAESQQALKSLDYGSALAYAVNDPTAADDVASARAHLTAGLLNAGDTRQDFLFNTILTDVNRRIAYSDAYDTDPAAAAAVVQTQLARLTQFGAALDVNDPSQPEAVTTPEKTKIQTIIDNLTIAADPNADPAARQTAIGALPSSASNIGQGMASAVDANKGVQDGTMIPAIVVPRDANGNPKGPAQWSVVPAQQDATGKTVPATAAAMTPIVVDGKVVYAEYTDIQTGDRQVALTGSAAQFAAYLPKNLSTAVTKWSPGQVIPTSYLSGLSPTVIAQLQAQGIITTGAPITVRGVVVPGGATTPAQTWVQDPETLLWYKDKLPTVSKPDQLGLGTVEVQASDANGNGGGPVIMSTPGSSQNGSYFPFAGDANKDQQALDSGALAPYIPPVQYRDANGSVTTDPAFAPDPHMMFVKPSYTLPSYRDTERSLPSAPTPASATSSWPMGQSGLPGQGPPPGVNLFDFMKGVGISAPVPTNDAHDSRPYVPPAAPTATLGILGGSKPNLPVVTVAPPAYTPPSNRDTYATEPTYTPPVAPKVTVATPQPTSSGYHVNGAGQ